MRIREQESELHALRRALKLRAEELVAEAAAASPDGNEQGGNAEVTAALLYAVAHGREQLAVASVAAEAAAEEARRREGAVASETGRVTELEVRSLLVLCLKQLLEIESASIITVLVKHEPLSRGLFERRERAKTHWKSCITLDHVSRMLHCSLAHVKGPLLRRGP